MTEFRLLRWLLVLLLSLLWTTTGGAASVAERSDFSQSSLAVNRLPQGLSASQFDDAAELLRGGAGHISDDIVVQGSRASGTARATSDIDFAVRVSPEQFNQMIAQRFGTAKLGTAKGRTMRHAIETGKIQAGEAGLGGLRRQLQNQLGMDVDLSIIQRGGAFDNGVTLPLP